MNQVHSGWILAGIILAAALSSAAAPVPDVVRFNRDIRPILSDNCFNCHGFDAGTREADLRLDLEEGYLSDRGGYFPVVPGKAEESEFFRRITATDRRDVMPPPDSGKELSERDIALMKRWIEQGAPFEEHWAYIPPQRPELPEIENSNWPRNSIDHFILARLEEEQLGPSREADRRTLIRRLSFDLTGLPPAPEEVREFLLDNSPDAYERLVERYLNSPHYGERMAAHWLDIVRYGDTSGFHGDQPVPVFPYRDYVIESFNRNKPFDQFTLEQIAGDLLPDATREQRIASGFNRLNRMTAEGGAQEREYLATYAADRVRNTSAAWLGLTVGCAECHDHKYDPVTIKDFYSFAAFFADLDEQGVYNRRVGWDPVMTVPSQTQEAEMRQLEATIAERTAMIRDMPAEGFRESQRAWEQTILEEIAAGAHAWTALRPAEVSSSGEATLRIQSDLSVLSSGKNPDHDTYTVTLQTDKTNVTGIRLETLTHPSLSDGRLSRGNGNFVLTGFEVEVATDEAGEATPVETREALADYEQERFPVTAALDGKPDTGWAVLGHREPADRNAVFIFDEPIPGGPGTVLTVRLKHESNHRRHVIGRFRLSLTSAAEPPLPGRDLPEGVLAAVTTPDGERTEEQSAAVVEHFRGIAPELAETREQLAAAEERKEMLDEEIPRTLISVSVEPREMRVLPRGNWMDDSGEIVTPAVPDFLNLRKPGGSEYERLTRLDLAQWLIARDNPLTARVFVNHLWKLFFGTGLSRTLDDFGSQGEWPSHPELLDWLAVEFMESGWDIQEVVRLIVTSSAYRQSSQETPRLREIDPFNRRLARQSRLRLDAEMIRDNALQISGLLVPEIGGPSIKPYQPEGYWDQLNFPRRTYEADTGEKQYRRGLYVHWQRTFLHPSLMAFDAPAREECTAERVRSNTPLQALALLNDPTYVEAARVFAERILKQGGSQFEQRLDWAYDRALSREPTRTERDLLGALYAKHLHEYGAGPDAAQELTAVGFRPKAENIDVTELAAWTSVSRAILNLHETISRY